MADENTVYGYDDQKLTHQPRVIFDYTSGRRTQLAWDANGNLSLLWDCKGAFTRFHDWDDENRLRMVVGNNRAGYYGYDANGDRVYKLTGRSAITNLSDEVSGAVVYLDSVVVYSNPYVTITRECYTKHYYANGERLASSIGHGGWCYMSSDVISQTQTDHEYDLQKYWGDTYQSYYPFEYPQEKLSKLTPNVDIEDKSLDELQYRCPLRRLKQLHIEYSQDMLLEAMYRFCDAHGGEEDEIFYTHGDHLGSANWITDYKGMPIQYLHYLPYGQLLANQQASWYDERYKFTGKERDAETGYDFFGARFYWSLLRHWTKVDPLVDDYLQISPYAYCNWNPVKYVDSDGQWAQMVVGALIGGASNYAFQVGMNMLNGDDFSTALTHDISLGSIAFSAAAGAIGAGLAKNVNKAQQAVKLANNAQKANKATRVLDNAKKGAEFERKVGQSLGKNKASQVTIKVKDGTKTRMDFVSIEDGKIKLTEAKSSATAPLTPNQKTAHPQIEQYGGTIKGNNGNNIGLPNGTEIPPTKVDIVRPNNLTD